MDGRDGDVLAIHGASMVGRVMWWQCVVVYEDVEDGGEMRSRIGSGFLGLLA